MTGGDLVKWGIIGLAGWWVYETFFATPATYTVKTLPANAPNGTQATVTDGTTTSDCTVGGGSQTAVCQSLWDGSVWRGWVPIALISQLSQVAAGGGTSTPASSPTTPAASTPAAPVNTSGFANLNALYNAMVAKAQAGMAAGDTAVTSSNGVLSATGYVWNYYLQAAAPSVNTSALNSVVGGNTYTSAAYWTVAGAGVGAQMGLSGLRLGLAGLGAVVVGGTNALRRRVR
jgi:hypothetical protein